MGEERDAMLATAEGRKGEPQIPQIPQIRCPAYACRAGDVAGDSPVVPRTPCGCRRHPQSSCQRLKGVVVGRGRG